MWHENDRASEAMVCTLIEGRHTETRHDLIESEWMSLFTANFI